MLAPTDRLRMQIRMAPLVLTAALAHAPLSFAAPSGSVEVGATGGVAQSWSGRRELTFVLSLSLPLDRAVAPREGLMQAPGDRGEAGAEPEERSPRAPPGLDPDDGWDPPVAELTPQLARATLEAAQRAAGQNRVRTRLDGLASRAKSSALLPELRLRAQRSTDESLRLAPTTADPYRYTKAGGSTLSLEARATWKLDRLVFAHEEVQVEHLRWQRAQQAARLSRQVLVTLVAWQRALWDRARPDSAPEARLAAELRRIEAEVRLDLLTGGRFSELVGTKRQKQLAERPSLE